MIYKEPKTRSSFWYDILLTFAVVIVIGIVIGIAFYIDSFYRYNN
jgi:hypothetical protein